MREKAGETLTSFTEKELLSLARRVRNAKRTYLLVNPLQAKHLPVSPARALSMMEALGRTLEEEKFGLVIGFAETATAIGAVAAFCQGEDCFYLTTTREEVPGPHRWIDFQEEHSHAAEQRLCTDHLLCAIEKAPRLLLVDDEISTGQTLLNVVRSLRRAFPALSDLPVTALSVINRVNAERSALLSEEGIEMRFLLRPVERDYEALVRGTFVREAEAPVLPETARDVHLMSFTGHLPDPRTGILAIQYREGAEKFAREVLYHLESVSGSFQAHERVLVLGTEECMLPALLTGALLERQDPSLRVRSHATTRSPIGIHEGDGYPVQSGFRLPGFYDEKRVTYLYSLEAYDTVLVITDASERSEKLESFYGSLFAERGAKRVLFAYGGSHVQHL